VGLEKQLAYYQEQLEALATTHPACQRLMTIPGIGPLSGYPETLLGKKADFLDS
jgi:transposase